MTNKHLTEGAIRAATNEEFFTSRSTPLGYRTFVTQSEMLVGCKQSMAAETHCAGTMDADSLDGIDTHSVIEFGCGRSLSNHCRGTVARQTTADQRSDGTMAAYGIYRTFFQGRFQLEILDIHLPETARRPKIAGVAAPSAASSMKFVRFTPSSQLCHRSGDARLGAGCLKVVKL